MITDPDLIRNLAAGMAGGVLGMFLLWCLLALAGRSTTRLRVFLAIGLFVGALGPVAFHAAAR